MQNCKILVLMLLLLPLLSFSQEPIWFSNTPPPGFKGRTSTFGMHKWSSVRGKRGKQDIIQWVRLGESVSESKYLDSNQISNLQLIAFDPSGSPVKIAIEKKGNSSVIKYDGEQEGFFNIYAIKKNVYDSTLYIDIAKGERLSHKCMNGHSHVRKMLDYSFYPKHVPFEIVREKVPRENFHYIPASSEEISFTTLYDGKPIENTSISFNSMNGWKKELKTNNQGLSEFIILNDYFSHWSQFNTRNLFEFLVVAKTEISKSGEHNGKSYNKIILTTTYTDFYQPASIIYKSFILSWGLIVAIVILGVFLIVLWRRKKNIRYKKIRFDE